MDKEDMGAWEARRAREEEGRRTRSSLTTVWHKIFASSNFCDFAFFSSDPQKLVPANKNYCRQTKKTYCRVNIL